MKKKEQLSTEKSPKVIRSVKLKITSDATVFDGIAANYLLAANWLSKIIYKSNKVSQATKLQKEFYSIVREKFHLPSQVTCSLFRHVVGTYKSMQSNNEWELAIYKRPTIPVGWKRDFILNKKGISFWKKAIAYKSRPIPKGTWTDSKLKKIKGQWYLCLNVSIEQTPLKEKGSIVGNDVGQKNIFAVVDLTSNKTLYVGGKSLNHRRLRIRQTRKRVAGVGTRSAYRLLKRLSGRERAVTQELCHLASKQAVAFAESVGAQVMVMEDLTGIKKKTGRKPKKGEKSKVHHKQRARNNRWPFAMLRFFIEYKAKAKGIKVEFVNPKNTSRGCPKCGNIEEANRNGLVFRCFACNYTDNADRVGAINLALRSLLQRLAVGERAVCQPAYSSHEGSGSSELQAPAFRQG